MPLISFSGVTSRGPFFQQIWDYRKTKTCRKPRKRPIKKGDPLYLYWKVRVPVARKRVHFIGEAVCTKVERLRYIDFFDDEEFARRDGFDDCAEMWGWFGSPFIHGHEIYDVISFKLKERLNDRR